MRLSHLGDIAQALPLIHAVRAAWPSAETAWAIQPEFAGLVEPLARPIPFARRGGAGAWPRIRRALRDFGPDLAIDAQGNWKSALVTRLSGAGRMVGFAARHWQEPLAARILGITCADPVDSGHLLDRVRSLGAAVTGVLPARRDPLLSEEELQRGARLLGAAPNGGSSGAPIVLHPGVPGDPRSWPEASFRALALRLLARGHWTIVLTGPGESGVGERLRASVPGARHIVAQRGLRDLAALLQRASDLGGCLVTGDSGPAHVAAAVGLPVRLLAGPEDPGRTGPWPIIGTADSPHSLVAPPAREGPWLPRPIESISVDAAETTVLGAPI